MGVLLWLFYTAVAIVVIAAVVAVGLALGAVIAGGAILALCVVAVLLVASLVKDIFDHFTLRRKRRRAS